MDPLSHMLFGRVIVATDARERLGRGAVGACVLGSLAPDLDAVLMPAGWDIYLRVHEVGTHCLLGTLACAGVVAAVARLVRRGSAYPRLLVAAWAGSLGHVYWDLVSGANIRVLWPLSDERVSAPLIAMADPIAAVPIVSGALAVIVWRRNAGTIAGVTLCVLAALLGAKLVLRHGALEAYRRATAERQQPVSHLAIEAQWGSPTGWRMYDRVGDMLRAWRVDGWTGEASLELTHRSGAPGDLVARSTLLDTVRNFQRAHDLAFVTVSRAAGGADVLWSDIRFCSPPDPAAWQLTHDGITCGLWFGGRFDASGQPTAQLVWLGHHLQVRSVR